MTFAFRTHHAAVALLALVTAVACSGDDNRQPTVPPPPDGGTVPPPPPPPDKTAPTLTARLPEPDDDNVWAGAPLRLTFSEPLAPATVTGSAITLQSEAGPVPAQTTLSADGREIRVALESPHLGPARLTVTIANSVTDVAGNAFAGAGWSWKVPLWQVPGKAPGAAGKGPLRPSLALDGEENPVVAWQDTAAGSPEIRAARLVDGRWQALGGPLNVRPDAVASSPRVVFSLDEGPIVVWQEEGTEKHVYAKRYRDGQWELMGPGPLDQGVGREAAQPIILLDGDRQPVVAWISEVSKVEIRHWRRGAWQSYVRAWDAEGAIADFAFEGTALVIAAAGKDRTDSDVRVVRWSEGKASWQKLGDVLDRAPENVASHPRVAVSRTGTVGVTWLENDGYSDNVYAARYEEQGGDWRLFGHALDVDFDAPTFSPSIGFAADGTPSVAWNESHADGPRTYVARFVGDQWEVPGAGLVSGAVQSAVATDVIVDSASNPVVLWEEQIAGDGGPTSQVWVRRYNGGSELRHGIAERRPPPCSFPLDGASDFPRTLSATKCFSDVARRVPAPGLVPYDINSPLWSDGAQKRRFIILPATGHIAFSEKFSWELPAGTILVKEFLYEREPGNPATIYPMETRFLIKRCEPGLCRAAWEGYSYQWNDAGTDAVLLDNVGPTVFKDWPSGTSKHKHGYPGRDECTQCHVGVAGGVLGLQTAQFNRNFDYGDVVDNQIRALRYAGLFGNGGDGGVDAGPGDGGTDGSSEPTADGGGPEGGTPSDGGTSIDGGANPDGGSGGPAPLPRLPVPNDPSFTTNERVRSYFHTNCSHCHRPDGRWPVIDFLYDAPLISEKDPDSNICNELVPGDAAKSRLYIKDAAREGNIPPDMFGTPMPPLASLVADERQLVALRNWINGMKSCP